MNDLIKAWVLRIMRVPAEPHVPQGSPESVMVFRAGRNFLRWSIIIWAFSHAGILALTLLFLIAIETMMFRFPPWVQTGVRIAEVFAVTMLAASWVITWFQIKLNYELRWYIVTDRSLRIRGGIMSVQELTMTFANIQEIRVSSTPLQVFLGLADVEVHTAGGGSGGPGFKGGHIGRFQGVDNADAIRDILTERLRVYRGSGLGDRIEPAPPQDSGVLEAALTVLAEARALRASLQNS